MTRFLLRRCLQGVAVLVAVLVASFGLLKFVPGDPARQVAGTRATEAQVEAIRENLGLNDNVGVQLWKYLGRLVQGDFGSTTNGSSEVANLIGQNYPVTVWLIVTSLVLTAIVSLVLSSWAVRRPGKLVDRLVLVTGSVGQAIPSFWLGIVLLIAVARPTGWFPIGGWGDSFGDRLRAVVLPCVTLTASLIPFTTRSLRTSMLEVRQSEFVAAGRSVGLDGLSLFRRFILRNSLVPTVALFASLAGVVLSGTVLVEATFALPGLGQMMVVGAINRDVNVVQGLTVVFAAGVIVFNLLGDVVVALLDPRVERR
ncbi:MAG: ABC transporter permease [Ilumatobacteraceae bacterium]